MKLKYLIGWMVATGLYTSLGTLNAQVKAFDPLLDSECEVLSPTEYETWNSTYMWYPGQLAAHLQLMQRQKSVERCVNVDYPGNFNSANSLSFFRKEVTVRQEVLMKWEGPSTIQCVVDGRQLNTELREYLLEPGNHSLFFEVQTSGTLPALIVQGKELGDYRSWQVSLDKHTWSIPETDYRYNKPMVKPDSEQELTVVIFPDKYIPLRNADCANGRIELGKHGRLIVDFRHLEVGNVKLKVTGSGNLSFNVGESLEEAFSDNISGDEQKRKPLSSFILDGKEQEIVLPERALRYLKITTDKPCTIHSLQFAAKVWPVNFQMQFECSDESLNDLWKAGVATLHTSMHNFYLDGVKRDYLPWSMDAIISMLGGDYVFGDRQISRNGLSIALMPPQPQATDWGIVDYPLHALLGFKQDYMRYGDLATSLMYKDRILQQMALYESIQDTNGFISAQYPTSGFIPGWSKKMGPENFGTPAYVQIMLYQNFVIAGYFAQLWEEDILAQHYEKCAKKLRDNILKHFWDDGRKAFVNGYTSNGKKDMRISHHAQYWAVLADLYPKQYYDDLFTNVLPSIPYYTEYVSYEKGYEFLAYVKAGRIKEMFALLDLVWGDWLKQGNTRFPENFSWNASLEEQLMFYGRPFGLSLCHGANGVPPIIAILYGILGFSQSDISISEYTLKPQMLNLNWVKGRIPIKQGYIVFSLTKDGKCTVEIPDDCILRIWGAEETLVLNKKGAYDFFIAQ